MLRRRTSPPPLSAELRSILLFGPWSVGKTLLTMPPHDELVALWDQHRADLEAALKRGQKPWFVERMWFVDQIRAIGRAP